MKCDSCGSELQPGCSKLELGPVGRERIVWRERIRELRRLQHLVTLLGDICSDVVTSESVFPLAQNEHAFRSRWKELHDRVKSLSVKADRE